MSSAVIDQVLADWDRLMVVATHVTGSRNRAGAAMEGLKLEAYYGTCYAGTKFLGANGGISNKAVQRMLRHLEDRGLITRTRRIRPNGTWGTHLIDWLGFWQELLHLLRAWAEVLGGAVRRGLKRWSVLGSLASWLGGGRWGVWDPGGG